VEFGLITADRVGYIISTRAHREFNAVSEDIKHRHNNKQCLPVAANVFYCWSAGSVRYVFSRILNSGCALLPTMIEGKQRHLAVIARSVISVARFFRFTFPQIFPLPAMCCFIHYYLRLRISCIYFCFRFKKLFCVL